MPDAIQAIYTLIIALQQNGAILPTRRAATTDRSCAMWPDSEAEAAGEANCAGSPGPRGELAARTWAMPADTNPEDRKSTRLNSSHLGISYAVFCLKKKKNNKM